MYKQLKKRGILQQNDTYNSKTLCKIHGKKCLDKGFKEKGHRSSILCIKMISQFAVQVVKWKRYFSACFSLGRSSQSVENTLHEETL